VLVCPETQQLPFQLWHTIAQLGKFYGERVDYGELPRFGAEKNSATIQARSLAFTLRR
jgi:hypothetical protein